MEYRFSLILLLLSFSELEYRHNTSLTYSPLNREGNSDFEECVIEVNALMV
jgi:hypothetical protein